MWFFVVCTLIDNEYAPLLFSQAFFELFLHINISEFAKVFERKDLPVQAAHLHNAAPALSNLSRCFQLSRQRFFFFDILVKNKSNVV